MGTHFGSVSHVPGEMVHTAGDLWVIVPAKASAQAKSRLASVLPPVRRQALVRRLLRRVLVAVRRAAPRAGIVGGVVISRDPGLLALAAGMGFVPLPETTRGGMNAALVQAVRATLRRGAEGVLILPLDLPHLTPADVWAVARRGRRGPCVVVAPDRAGTGTNALLLRPPGIIVPAFGAGSAPRHLAAARRRGAVVHVLRRRGLSHDVDWPEHLQT